MKHTKRCFCLILFVTLLDQITKCLAKLFLIDRSVMFTSFLSFRYAENTGAAWNILWGCPLLLGIFGIIVLATIFMHWGSFNTNWKKFSGALICGGILGNTIDRIFRGFVVDFVCVDLKFYKWPIFNIADSALCIGTTILLFTFLTKPQEAN